MNIELRHHIVSWVSVRVLAWPRRGRTSADWLRKIVVRYGTACILSVTTSILHTVCMQITGDSLDFPIPAQMCLPITELQRRAEELEFSELLDQVRHLIMGPSLHMMSMLGRFWPATEAAFTLIGLHLAGQTGITYKINSHASTTLGTSVRLHLREVTHFTV